MIEMVLAVERFGHVVYDNHDGRCHLQLCNRT